MSFNHGWVVGGTDTIPEDVQYELEGLLRPER